MIHLSLAARGWGSLAPIGSQLAVRCSTFAGAEPPEPVVVGVDLDLTGPGLDAVFGQALQVRAEQVDQQREFSGGRPVRLQVLDNGADPDTSVANLVALAGVSYREAAGDGPGQPPSGGSDA